jgi:hypothetical protein
MKLITNSFFALVFITFVSCKNHLDKSVIEPMEIETLKTIIEKDTLFESTYQTVEHIRKNVLTNDVQKAKWSDLTYGRVHNMIRLYNDSLTQSKYTKELKKEWHNKYAKYDSKVDSIANYWQKYITDNSINNYLTIKLFDVQTSDNGSVKIGFKISPHKRGIEDLIFEYVFIEKEAIKDISEWDRHPVLNDNTNRFYLFKEIPESKIYWETNFRNSEVFENRILEEVLDKYIFKYKVNSLKLNGKRVSDYNLEIPIEVERYLNAKKENSFLIDYYKADLIKEYLNINYVRYNEYIQPFIDSIAKSEDSRVVQFFKLSKIE